MDENVKLGWMGPSLVSCFRWPADGIFFWHLMGWERFLSWIKWSLQFVNPGWTFWSLVWPSLNAGTETYTSWYSPRISYLYWENMLIDSYPHGSWFLSWPFPSTSADAKGVQLGLLHLRYSMPVSSSHGIVDLHALCDFPPFCRRAGIGYPTGYTFARVFFPLLGDVFPYARCVWMLKFPCLC